MTITFALEASFLHFMTTKDIEILHKLTSRVDNLPEILHLRAAEPGYVLTEADKRLLLETYQDLDDILKEVAAFINVKFPGREDHIHAWNEIDFDTKFGPIKIVTTDREHIKRAWRKGVFDLKSLIKTLRNESVLLVQEENHIMQKAKATERRIGLRQWLEIISWIAGIVSTIIAIYSLA